MVMQEPMVPQVTVHIVNEDRIGQATPEFRKVGLHRIKACSAYRIADPKA